MVHAADVPTTQKEKVSKSDPVDSKKLAKALMRGELGSVYIHSKDSLDDRALVRHRATIVKLSGGIKSRIKHLLYNNGVEYPEEYFRSNRHWTRSFITWLQNDVRLLSDTRVSLDLLIAEVLHYRERLLDVNRRLRSLARSDRYAEKYGILMSVPGIGSTIAMSLLTEIDDIG
ncbi:IS110 family transposase, partial [Muribaculaceae bacterium Isolate-104 (HZI)]